MHNFKEMFDNFINEGVDYSIEDDFALVNKLLKSLENMGNARIRTVVGAIRVHVKNIKREMNKLQQKPEDDSMEVLDEMSSMGGGAVEGGAAGGPWGKIKHYKSKPYSDNEE